MVIPVSLWTAVWGLINYHHPDFSLLIIGGIFLFMLIAELWHIALIADQEGRRLAYLAYAIVFMPAFFYLSLVAGMAACNINIWTLV
jgi:hypothetical protein